MGKRGYLANKGLVPLPDDQFRKVGEAARTMPDLQM
jgi:hypothetical protein